VTSLTVREIAERIREPGEDLTAVVDRLRNYTKEGLLKPAGSRHPGTGRRRRYPERAVIDAAILSKLSQRFGIPASRVPYFGKALDLAVKASSQVKEQAKRGYLIYLVVADLDCPPIHFPSRTRGNFEWVDDESSGGDKSLLSELVYVIDKSSPAGKKILSSRIPGVETRLVAVPVRMEQALIINLTKLFIRINITAGVGNDG
jgi:DNA-binding transcriptional MerR regulator